MGVREKVTQKRLWPAFVDEEGGPRWKKFFSGEQVARLAGYAA